jgi:hypothetical protein
MLLQLLLTAALLAWNFHVNSWQSAVLLVGLYVGAIIVHSIAGVVLFGGMRDVERYRAKRAGVADTGDVSHNGLDRFGAMVFAVADAVYAGVVFRHFPDLAPQSVAIFFVACASSRFLSFTTSRFSTRPQSIVGTVIAMVIYAAGFMLMHGTA